MRYLFGKSEFKSFSSLYNHVKEFIESEWNDRPEAKYPDNIWKFISVGCDYHDPGMVIYKVKKRYNYYGVIIGVLKVSLRNFLKDRCTLQMRRRINPVRARANNIIPPKENWHSYGTKIIDNKLKTLEKQKTEILQNRESSKEQEKIQPSQQLESSGTNKQ